jgi:hypothetical protein
MAETDSEKGKKINDKGATSFACMNLKKLARLKFRKMLQHNLFQNYYNRNRCLA